MQHREQLSPQTQSSPESEGTDYHSPDEESWETLAAVIKVHQGEYIKQIDGEFVNVLDRNGSTVLSLSIEEYDKLDRRVEERYRAHLLGRDPDERVQ